MRRRELVMLLGAAALAQPAFSQDNRPGLARIGFIGNGPASEHRLRDAFVAGLRDHGFVEGQDCTVLNRFAEGELDRLLALAEDLVRENVDVIVLAGPAAIRAAQSATSTVPIVVAITGDPVVAGFVRSLAHPGGNLTGLSMNNTEISGKHLELLQETTPSITRVAALVDASLMIANGLSEVELAAQSLGLALQVLRVTMDDLDRAFAAAERERAQAMLVLPTPRFNFQSRRARLADLALRHGLPSMYEEAAYVRDGGLMSYGPSFEDMYRRAAVYVAKILKGVKPGDLPIEQPAKFELAVNLRTAKALGLAIPQSILARADELIE
jgi:putative ABC transport system substrate-binding protein